MNNQQKENVIKILGYLSEANVVLEKLEEKRSREPSNLGLQMAGEENWKKLFQLGCIIPLMSTTWKKGRKKWLKYRLSYYRPLEAGAYLYDLMNKRGHGSYSRYMTVIKDYNGIRRTVNAKKILRSFFFEPIPDFPEYEFAESLNLKKCKGAEQWENEIRDIADFIGTVHIEPDIAYMCDTDELNMDIKTTIGNVADYIENNRDSFSFSNGIERKRWLEFADIYSEKVINKLNKNFKRDEYVYSIFNPRVYSWIRNRRKKK